MKIVHVYKDYAPVMGGIENHLRTLAEGQVAVGHEVDVLVTNPAALPSREVVNGVRIRRVQRIATVSSTPLSIALIRALRSLQPDVTHLHFPYPIGEIAQLASGGNRPYVITYHSDVVRQKRLLFFYKPLLMRVLRGSQRILVTSEAYVRSSPYLRAVREKCVVVPLSVDPARFAHATPLVPKQVRKTILFVGRQRYYKGVDDLLRAMPALNARLLLGGDGPMRSEWESLAAELGLSERVHFLGDIPEQDLPGLYASADIFTLPANSRAEAFGKVLLEAMAAGLPCITTELGTGTSYVVQHGITGLVVPPKDPDALASAVRRLLDDDGLRQRMGQCGRQRVQQEFSTERMIEEVERVYHLALTPADDV